VLAHIEDLVAKGAAIAETGVSLDGVYRAG